MHVNAPHPPSADHAIIMMTPADEPPPPPRAAPELKRDWPTDEALKVVEEYANDLRKLVRKFRGKLH